MKKLRHSIYGYASFFLETILALLVLFANILCFHFARSTAAV